MAMIFDQRLLMPRQAGPRLTVVNNGDGTATWTLTGYTHPDSGGGVQVVAGLTPGTSDLSPSEDSYNVTTGEFIVNDPYNPYYFRFNALDSENEVIAHFDFGPVTTTGDTAGYAYAEAVNSHAGDLLDYDAEQWLFSQWRADGVLSKISDGMIRGHNSEEANLVKVISLDSGTFPGGAVTTSTGYITYSSDGYGSFVTNMNAMPGISLNSHGIMIDLPLAIDSGKVAMAARDLLKHQEIVRDATNWYCRLGSETGANFSVSIGSYTAGMFLATRTSATAGALYHCNGTTFSTVGTSNSLSGGDLAAVPMFTGIRNNNGTALAATATNTRERAAFVTAGMSAVEAELFLEALYTYYEMKGWV